MKPLHVFPALLCLALTALSMPAAGEPIAEVDRIVAVVNDGVIVKSELDRELRSVVATLREKQTRLPPPDILEEQVLERMIIKLIQLQLAEATGIRATDEMVNRTIGKIAAKNNLSLEQFQRIIENDGYSFAGFREDIRNRLVLTRLKERQVDNRVQVTDREVDNYLANLEVQGEIADEYHLGHILVAVPEAASPETIAKRKARAERIIAMLNEGRDFQEIAVEYSDGQQALEGGDLGFRKASEIPSLFAEIVPAMEPGALAGPIRSASGFHILKLFERRSGEDEALVTQTRVRHILIRVNDEDAERDARSRIEQLHIRLLGGADFADLALSNSEDPGSAARGGDLGWMSPGALVPEFEQVMNSLAIDEISRPFRSRFGYHIVQVLDRREYDNSEEMRRSKARLAIRARKIEEEYQSWIRSLRDEAFVEYRLER